MRCCGRWRCAAPGPAAPGGRAGRILCFRLERIGDLLMTLPALAELRALAPGATIDLVVGSWNREIAGSDSRHRSASRRSIAAWLARSARRRGCLPFALAQQAARLAGARVRSRDQLRARHPHQHRAGGDRRAAHRRVSSAAAAARCSISRSTSTPTRTRPTTPWPWFAPRWARGLRRPPPCIARHSGRARASRPRGCSRHSVAGPRVGIHVSGGREIKQWPESRFREVAEHLVRNRRRRYRSHGRGLRIGRRWRSSVPLSHPSAWSISPEPTC